MNFSLIALISFAQTNTDSLVIHLQQSVMQLTSEIKRQQADFSKKISSMNDSIIKLHSEMESEKATITVLADSLGIYIADTQTNTTKQIQNIQQKISTNTLYWIIAVLTIALFSSAIFVWLRRKQQSDKTDMIDQLSKTRSAIMSEGAKLDKELSDLLEKQLVAINNTRTDKNDSIPVDHTMPLKVADEITRINAYANTLDPNSQDAKALKSSVKRLFNTFISAQYEIVDLSGQKYDDGLKVIVVNAIPDENLKEGEEIISRIIKPLVKYKGEQIQAAQVEISVGQ